MRRWQHCARGLAVLLGAACILVLPACSATESGEEEPKAFDPRVTEAQIAQFPDQSPKSTVMRLWRYAQLGSTPNVVSVYHPRVQGIVGRSTIAGAYSIKRPFFTSTKPRIASAETTRIGTLVRVETTTDVKDGKIVPAAQELPKSEESFLLRKHRGRWTVIHDTVLERGLNEYTLSLEAANPDGTPTRRAMLLGREAAQRYRELFLPRDR